MPTTHPRVNAALDPSLYEAVAQLAEAQGVSLSQQVRDLVKDALEIAEDAGWETLVAERRARKTRWLSHAEVRRRFGKRS